MFIQLRITPSMTTDPSLCKTFLMIQPLVEWFGQEDIATFCVASETTNKFGEETHPHWHINITGDFSKDIRKDSFQAWFRRRPFHPKGNKSYSFKIVGDPEDEERWHRYLLKEGRPLQGFKSIPMFPEDFDLDLQRALAMDERKIQIKRNIDARERMLNNSSFKHIMFQDILRELQKESIGTIISFYDVWILIQGYFRHKGKVVPYDSLSNYVYDFMITYNILTPSQYFMQRMGAEDVRMPHREMKGILRSPEE